MSSGQFFQRSNIFWLELMGFSRNGSEIMKKKTWSNSVFWSNQSSGQTISRKPWNPNPMSHFFPGNRTLVTFKKQQFNLYCRFVCKMFFCVPGMLQSWNLIHPDLMLNLCPKANCCGCLWKWTLDCENGKNLEDFSRIANLFLAKIWA